MINMTEYESRKWIILVATIWIQAFTGTNFDFSAYSSELKGVLGISQVQLNYLATASDLGKALGWSSGLALMYMPLWSVMFVAAFMGLFGYGIQWLIILHYVSLPYFVVSIILSFIFFRTYNLVSICIYILKKFKYKNSHLNGYKIKQINIHNVLYDNLSSTYITSRNIYIFV